jgi:hypothetical protein
LINNDGELDADFDEATYSWRGREMRLEGGLTSFARAAFSPIPGGNVRILDVHRGEDYVDLIVAPLAERPDRPVQTNLYSGRGGAYDFAGTASVACGDVYNLGLKNFTVSGWFNSDTISASGVILDKRGSLSASPGTPGLVVFFNSSAQLRVFLDDGSAIEALSIGSAGAYDDDVWHVVTITVSRTTDELVAYVDGVEVLAATDISTLTGSLSTTAGLFHGSLGGSSDEFPGQLDEITIWQRVLPANEVLSRSKIATDGTEDGLVGAWHYDERTGTFISQAVRGPMLVQPVFTGSITCNMGDTCDPGTGDFTLLGWCRVADAAGGVIAGRKAGTGTALGYAALVASGQVVLEASDGTTLYQVTVGTDVDDDTAFGWAMVREGDELRGYILDYPRGTLTAGTPDDLTGAGTLGGGSLDFVAGAYDDGAVPLTGKPNWLFWIDEALTESDLVVALSDQIAEIDSLAPTVPRVAYKDWQLNAAAHFWPLHETAGTNAADRIGSDNGTYNSAPTRIDRHGTLTPGLGSAWTTTEEGGEELKGKPKPVLLGYRKRIHPALVDDIFLVFQYSDPLLGPTQEVEAVYSGAVELDLTTDYTVDLDRSTITMVGNFVPEEPITLDAKGIIDPLTSEWLQYPGEITAFVWRELVGIDAADISAPRIAAYDDLHSYESGLYLDTCSLQLDCVHEKMLSPDGYAYRATDNKMSLGTRRPPGTVEPELVLPGDEDGASTLIATVTPMAVPPPSWLVAMGYDRTGFIGRSFASGVDMRGRQLNESEYRYVVERREDVLLAHADALPRTYNTPHQRRLDAALLAARVISMDATPWNGLVITLAAEHWAVDLGDEVEIEAHSRYDWAGKRYVVVGYEYGISNGDPTSTLVLCGGVDAEEIT